MTGSDRDERRWPRFSSIVGIVVLVGALLFVFAVVPQVFLYTFFAVLIGVLLQSAAALLERLGLPHGPSLAVVLVAILGLLVGTGFLFGPTLADQLEQIATEIPQTLATIEERLGETPIGRELMERIPFVENGAEGDAQNLNDAAEAGAELMTGAPLSRVTTLLRGLIAVFGHVFYVLIIGIFLAAAPHIYRGGAVQLFPVRREGRAAEVMDALHGTLRAWLLGQLVAMTFVGACVVVGLALLGVPFAFGLGFLAFLFEFIPTIGPWIAGVPAVLIAFTVSPGTALWVAVLFVAIELLEGNVLLPIVYERAVELPPALTLFSIFLLGSLFGFVGVLVAAPLAAVAVTVVRELYLPHATRDGAGASAAGGG